MEIWMLFLVIAIIAVVIEIFVPSLFCINFAFAGIITSLISIFWGDIANLSIVFVVVSVLSILLVKPMLVKLLNKETKADFDTQYIGKVVKSIEPISAQSGAVTIYDERWEARLITDGEEIPANTDVKIIKNDSTTLFVEKI